MEGKRKSLAVLVSWDTKGRFWNKFHFFLFPSSLSLPESNDARPRKAGQGAGGAQLIAQLDTMLGGP